MTSQIDNAEYLQIAGDVLAKLRLKAPNIHCMTNLVAQSITANVLLALGAVPSMTVSKEEVADFTKSSNGLLLNLGTLSQDRQKAMERALEAAKSSDLPIVVDPVFIHRSEVRKSFAEKLLQQNPAAVRGNALELAELNLSSEMLVIETGKVDKVTFNGRAIGLDNGHKLMAKTTAMGCALGAVIAAAMSVHGNKFEAAIAALLIFNVAGEMAGDQANGPGSFIPLFIDQLYNLDASDISQKGKLTNAV